MILVLDTETTGLVKHGVSDFLAQPGICQIAAIKLDRTKDARGEWFEAGHISTLVNPEIAKWEDGAMKTHGMTPETVASAPTFFEIFPKLAEFATGCQVFAGYNVAFDKDVLWYQLLRYGFERSFPWPPKEYDVMKVAALHLNLEGKRGQKYPKLMDAYSQTFGESFTGAHDALNDVRATARLLMEWYNV